MSQILPEPQASDSAAPFTENFKGILLALQFLTILPIKIRSQAQQNSANLAPALPWFPVVGLLLGSSLALLDYLLQTILSGQIRDALILVAMALITGMLHLDGFVDCCDALLGYRTAERRLEILRDSRVGAYGTIGAVLLLLTQFAALESLPSPLRVLGIILAPVLGRWGMVYAITAYPYIRASGAGMGFRQNQGALLRASLAAMTCLFMAIAITIIANVGYPFYPIFVIPLIGNNVSPNIMFIRVIIIACIDFLMVLGWTRWACRQLGGGLSGDTYGALNELIMVITWISLPAVSSILIQVGI
jgi:adenosylcobinamide-GDP ribazoletransferase